MRRRPWSIRAQLVAVVGLATVVFTASVAAADGRAGVWSHAAIGVVALAVMLLLVLVVHRRLVRPLRELTRAVQQAGREITPNAVNAEGPTEVSALMNEFNAMIRARSESEAALAHHVLHDALTGLPNRTLCIDRLTQALNRAARSSAGVAVLILDVERFTLINQGLGHDVGDRVLVEVADRLTRAIRPGDTIARFVGDQFVVICEGISANDQASTIARRLQRAVGQPIETGTEAIVLRAAVGIAISGEGATPESLLRDSDAAMTRAKELGSGSHAFFDRTLRDRAVNRFRVEREIHTALERGELTVRYQPMVNLETGAVEAVEALVRWFHPVRGVVSPMEFLPVAEESGLMVPLGSFVLEQACTQSAAWKNEGRPVQIAVNLSGRELAAPSLPSTLSRILEQSGIEPSRLCLEITESSLVADKQRTAALLAEMRGLGVRISLDDFGTGYSSLAYLQDFPLDQLKIDRSFVASLDRGDPAVVRAIAALGHALGLQVVAEGIEDLPQLVSVISVGCDVGQGFYFQRPEKPADVAGTIDTGFRHLIPGVSQPNVTGHASGGRASS